MTKNVLFLILLFVGSLAVLADDLSKPPLPLNFPELGRFTLDDQLRSDGTGQEPEFTKIVWAGENRKIWQVLNGYSSESIAKEFGVRMKAAGDVHMKLVLAAIAAGSGNQEAREFIEKTADDPDYETVRSQLCALEHLANELNPQDWVLNAISQVLKEKQDFDAVANEPRFLLRKTPPRLEAIAEESSQLSSNLERAKSRRRFIEAEHGDPIPKCVELISAAKAAGQARSEELNLAFNFLEESSDRRAAPVLLEVIKRGGRPAYHAIVALRHYRYKIVLPGLIDCLAVNFQETQMIKWRLTPEQFREEIASSLQILTGESFGPDKEQWQKWWFEKGKALESLK